MISIQATDHLRVILLTLLTNLFVSTFLLSALVAVDVLQIRGLTSSFFCASLSAVSDSQSNKAEQQRHSPDSYTQREIDIMSNNPKLSSGKLDSDMCPSTTSGLDYIRNPRLFKGMAFSLEERQYLGIHGLLPPRMKSQAEQVDNCMRNLKKIDEPLFKYMYLIELMQRNERLYYKVLSENVMELMPIVYTPTVGLACQKFGYTFKRPQGLFITIHDKGHIFDLLRNWPEQEIRAIVVTDGERILGLGDLGAHGMGITIGKLTLYTALAGIKPQQTIPITLDVGTNNEELLKDADYIGLRQRRVTGQEYDDFIEEFMQAVVRRYGQNTLIQFEDFGNRNAFRLLEKYRDKYCTFNDDIQGTASVTLAGILAALKATNTKLSDHVFLFQGAGEAAIGIANLIAMALKKSDGLSYEEAVKRIWMKDSKGLIVKDRPEGGITQHKAAFAHEHEPIKELRDIVQEIKPTVLIGAAAIGGVFTKEILNDMATFNKQPIIFALSNPTSKAECTAEEAYKHTEGRAVFASGSPFDPVEYNGKTFEPGQGNNAYIFPGVALGVICAGIRHISDEVFLSAAEGLADMVTETDLAVGRLYPPQTKIQECSVQIAASIMEDAYKNRTSSTYPEPEDKLAFIKSQLYDYNYDDVSALPDRFDWPKEAQQHFSKL